MHEPHRLLVYQPGHFHAALTLRVANPRVEREVHVYAHRGPELDAFCALVDAFNNRREEPTNWRLVVHAGPNPLEALLREQHGDVAVLAGRNDGKLEAMARMHAAGINVFADKPWVTSARALPSLQAVTATGGPVCMDIMTERFDTVAMLRKALLGPGRLLGPPRTGSGEPVFEIGSVHHLYKLVNGSPLRRPAWYYDVQVQGDGLVDIQTHMTDQAQWLLADEGTRWQEHPVDVLKAARWPTQVPLDLFEDSTGLGSFPATLADRVQHGVLGLECNGLIEHRVNGHLVSQRAEWGQREPAGSGDLHHCTVRGERATLHVEHNALAGHEPLLTVMPRPGSLSLAQAHAAVAALQEQFPGLALATAADCFRLCVPAELRTSHESHFAMALEEFLDLVDAGEPPAELRARVRWRHTLLATAHSLAERQGAGA